MPMSDRPVRAAYGSGLLAPLRRDAGRDFVSGSDDVLVASAIQQILKTARGDLPWRPSFGGGLDRFRNRGMSEAFLHEVEAYVISAITHYEPRVSIERVWTEAQGKQLFVFLTWRLMSSTQRGDTGNVIAGPFTTSVRV